MRRRTFLQAAAVAALGCGPPLRRGLPPRHVAIVGAGLSGLVCARELIRVGVRPQVYEAQGRVGGRLVSKDIGDGRVIELGGEFIDSSHTRMHALAKELGIVLDDRKNAGRETYWFDGRDVLDTEIAERLASVAPKMRSDLQREAEVDAVSIPDWLRDAGADPLLVKIIDAAYTTMYGIDIGEQSALNLLSLIDAETLHPLRLYGDSDERFHAHTGSESFPRALLESMQSRLDLHLGYVLEAVSESGDGSLRLSFRDGSTTRERVFDHVVLTVPFSVLRNIRLDVDMPAHKRTAIAELGYGTSAKLIVETLQTPWRDRGQSGYAFSDLGWQSVWDASIGQPGPLGVVTNFVGGRAGREFTKRPLREHTESLVSSLAPVLGEVAAQRSWRASWHDQPYAMGSYSCYRPGQWRFAGVEGLRVRNLHFAGEHTSVDYQGYMEGAAESGERAAREIGAAK